RMSALGIPQIAAVMGSCTAGGAYVPAMCDEAVIVRNEGTIFLGGPPLVKAATGEGVDPQEPGGAAGPTRRSAVAHHLAEADAPALEICRDTLAGLNRPKRLSVEVAPPEEPRYAAEEIYGVLPRTFREAYEVREVIARLVDGSRL